MNLGMTTSFIIGGLLLLSILHMTFTVQSNSMQTTLQSISKKQVQTISQVITADFKRMGYGVNQSQPVEDVIHSISSDKISFEADIDDNGITETITWEFTNTKYTSSANPNDYKLIRTGPVSPTSGSVETTYPATSFDFTYYNIEGNVTTNRSEVDRIKIEVVCESPQKIAVTNGDDIFGRSFWQRTIVPPSVHLRQTN